MTRRKLHSIVIKTLRGIGITIVISIAGLIVYGIGFAAYTEYTEYGWKGAMRILWIPGFAATIATVFIGMACFDGFSNWVEADPDAQLKLFLARNKIEDPTQKGRLSHPESGHISHTEL